MTFPFSQATLFGQLLITAQYPATMVVAGSRVAPLSVLIINNDPVNSIYLTNNSAYLVVDVTKVTPLPAGSSVVFDGTQDVFAFTAPGTTAQVTLFPSGINFTAGGGIKQLAQAGGLTGTPAATLPAAGQVVILNQVDVSAYTSYDLNMYAYASSPGIAGAPFSCQVQLQWFDDLTSGIPVFEEDWWPWIGRAAIASIGVGGNSMNPLAGAGPMHGRYLSVIVALPGTSTTGAILQWFNFFGSARTMPYSDWRQQMTAVNPQVSNLVIQPPSFEPDFGFDNVLATISSGVLSANTVAFVPFNLYAGPAYYRLQASAAPANAATISIFGGLVGGNPIAGSGTPNILTSIGADANDHEGTIILPRAACALIIKAPVAAITYSFQITGQQAA